MRFHVLPRPLDTDATTDGHHQQQHDHRRAELDLPPGRGAIVSVHADGEDAPVTGVEDHPGPWSTQALTLVRALGTTTPQGLADHFDGIVVPATTVGQHTVLGVD